MTTDAAAEPAGKAPAPAAAAPPAAAARPAPPAETAPAPDASPAGDADLRAENERLKLKLEAAGQPQGGRFTVPTIQMRIAPGTQHVLMEHGGLRIEREWTEVPRSMVAALSTAAADSNVQLEQKEEG